MTQAIEIRNNHATQSAVMSALIAHYTAHGFTPEQAQWAADRDRENKSSEFKLATMGELK